MLAMVETHLVSSLSTSISYCLLQFDELGFFFFFFLGVSLKIVIAFFVVKSVRTLVFIKEKR